MSKKELYSAWIKEEAKRLGFAACGISEAGFLEEEAPRLERWLEQGMHGQMQYMENHFDKRLDPRLLVDGAKSVVSLVLNYYPEAELPTMDYKISKYAYGTDYHVVIKDKLKALIAFIRAEIGGVDGRAFVDSAPVLDKAWAAKSGLGWIGKNNNLIRKREGSFFFIAELILDLDLETDGATTHHCGHCTLCLDSCPTRAIESPYIVNGSKCISYLTIELKDAIPASFKDEMQDWVFGCDVCQDVCPWNRFASPHEEPLLRPNSALKNFQKEDWEELTEQVFKRVFQDSAIQRTRYEGLMRNINFVRD